MEKTIGAYEARRQFGKMLTGILAGDRYIIKRHGEPVAVLVPVALYEQWQRGRDRFTDHIEAVARAADMGDEEATELVREVIREERRDMFERALAASERNPDLEDTAVLAELEQLDAERPPTVAPRESGRAPRRPVVGGDDPTGV